MSSFMLTNSYLPTIPFVMSSVSSNVTDDVKVSYYNKLTKEVTIIFSVTGSRTSSQGIYIVPSQYASVGNADGVCVVTKTDNSLITSKCYVSGSNSQIYQVLTSQETLRIMGIIKYIRQ